MRNLVFSPIKLRNVELKNRFCVQPLEGNDANNDGSPSIQTTDRYIRWTKGKWALIFVEATSISLSEESKSRIKQLVLNKKNKRKFKNFVEKIKEKNNILLLIQLNYGGRYSLKPTISYHHPFYDKIIRLDYTYPVINEAKVNSIFENFIECAIIAQDVGFDGVDIKCCHGNFIIDYIRPANKNKTFEEKVCLFIKTLKEIRENTKKDFIIGSRISFFEGTPEGFGTGKNPNDLSQLEWSQPQDLIRKLKEIPVDFINETVGIPYIMPHLTRPSFKDENPQKYIFFHYKLTKKVKKELLGNTKTIDLKTLVKKKNGIYSTNKGNNETILVIGSAYTFEGKKILQIADKQIKNKEVDIIGFGRQALADPYLPLKLEDGELSRINYCITCNKCAKMLHKGHQSKCAVYSNKQ